MAMESKAKLRGALFRKLDPDGLRTLGESKKSTVLTEIDGVLDFLLEVDFPHWSEATRLIYKNSLHEEIAAMTMDELADAVSDNPRFHHENLMRDLLVPSVVACILFPVSLVSSCFSIFDRASERPQIWPAAQRLVTNYWPEKRGACLCCPVSK